MAVDLLAKQQNFISRAIDASDQFLAAADDLDDLRREYVELGYGATFTEDIFAGDLAHLDIATLIQFGSAIQALTTALDSGHRATFLKMRR